MRQTAVFKFPGHSKVNLASKDDLVTTVCHATVCPATVVQKYLLTRDPKIDAEMVDIITSIWNDQLTYLHGHTDKRT